MPVSGLPAASNGRLILTRRLASPDPGTFCGIAPDTEDALTGTQAN